MVDNVPPQHNADAVREEDLKRYFSDYKMLDIVPTKYFCKVLDHLPPLPVELVPDVSVTKPNLIWSGREIIKEHQPPLFTPTIKTWKEVPSDLVEWIRSNITASPLKVLFRKIEVDSIRNFYYPHVDTGREFVLIYNTDHSGGDIVYWRYKDLPAFTDQLTQVTFDNYENLTEVYRMPTPVGKWYLLNNTCIHSVEGMTGIRAGVQVSLSKNDPLVDYLNGADRLDRHPSVEFRHVRLRRKAGCV